MAVIQTLLLLTSAVLTSCQRPSFAGFRPIGFPELQNKTTTPSALEDKFGEGTTQRLPIEALGDRELVDRLSKLPIDKQPFWFLNWQALEAERQKPQTYPLKPNPFIESNLSFNSNPVNANTGFANTNPSFGNADPGFANANPSFPNANPGDANSNTGFVNTNPSFGNSNPAFPNANPGAANSNTGFANTNQGFPNANPGLPNANSGFVNTNPSFGNANSGFANANPGFPNANPGFVNANPGQSPQNGFFSTATSNAKIDNRYGIKTNTSNAGPSPLNSNAGIVGGDFKTPVAIEPDYISSNHKYLNHQTDVGQEENEFEDIEVKKFVKNH